jgi:hypothetical protein
LLRGQHDTLAQRRRGLKGRVDDLQEQILEALLERLLVLPRKSDGTIQH